MKTRTAFCAKSASDLDTLRRALMELDFADDRRKARILGYLRAAAAELDVEVVTEYVPKHVPTAYGRSA